MKMNRTLASLLSASLWFGCGPAPQGTMDGASDGHADAVSPHDVADGAAMCSRDLDCTDGLFCNGVELCMPGAAGSDARGCVRASAPACLASQNCSESMARCVSNCGVAMDADHDGHNAIACGGDDCDDADANRFPGNQEVCAFSASGTGSAHRLDGNHDEDCNPATFENTTTHDGDHDGDGFVDVNCANVDSVGTLHAGNDCNDADPVPPAAGSGTSNIQPGDIHPMQGEICNGVDDNCNGQVDEGVLREFFPDMDHDNFGDQHGMPTFACAVPSGFAENSLDCADTNAAISPVASETCDGVDNNCNNQVDELPAAAIACAATYGSPANTRFDCPAGTGMCAVSCNGSFQNCDGRLDNGCESDGTSDVANCGACAHNCGAGGTCTAGVCDYVTAISAGADYACASRSSGHVACWGVNAEGQLGDGTTTDRALPVTVLNLQNAPLPDATAPLSNFTPISVTRFDDDPYWNTCSASCAQNGSTIICWGCNQWGQGGIGTNGGSIFAPFEPVAGIPGFGSFHILMTVQHISVGGGFVLGGEIADREFILSWGNSQWNILQRTLATPSDAWTPGQISNAALVGYPSTNPLRAVSAGRTHACFARNPNAASSNTAYCWGQNVDGQLGNGSSSSQYTAAGPVAVAAPAGSTQWVDISAGDLFTCAVTNDGRVACWGDSAPGIPSTVPFAMQEAPYIISGLSNVAHVVTGHDHACAMLNDQTVRCWGANGAGQLGNGTTTASGSPITPTGLGTVMQLSAGKQLTCAVTAAHVPMCWGHFGGPTPTRVPGL